MSAATESAALSVRCPTCRVSAGEPCVSRNKKPHLTRQTRALPLLERVRDLASSIEDVRDDLDRREAS